MVGFYVAFARVKQLVADFRANEKFQLFPKYSLSASTGERGEVRCRDSIYDDLDRCPSLAGAIDFQPSAFSLRYCLFGALTPAEIKIVEGAAK